VGVEGYLAAASVRGVVAQRLVRKICDRCGEPAELDDQQFSWLDALVGEEKAHQLTFYRGRVCNQCNQTGFYGRIGVFELLELNEDLANMLRAEDAVGFSELARRQPGYRPLVVNALDYALAGQTSISEVLALSGQVEDIALDQQSLGLSGFAEEVVVEAPREQPDSGLSLEDLH